jgi:Leucine-rich repeat (LRR) protein
VVGIDFYPGCNGSCSGNNLTGKILQTIGNLTFITRIDFAGDNLTSLPAEIGNLVQLTYLNLYSNDLTSVPPEIGNLTNLTTLYLILTI